MIETFGGLLMMIGLFTRPVALILSGEMAVAYFKFHAPQGLWPLLNDGEGAVFYCFIKGVVVLGAAPSVVVASASQRLSTSPRGIE